MQGDVIVVGSPETVVNSGAIKRGGAYVFERIAVATHADNSVGITSEWWKIRSASCD